MLAVVTSIEISGNSLWMFVEVLVMVVFLGLVWGLSLAMSRTENPDTRFYCGVGLYGCYLLGTNAIYLFVLPWNINNAVERGVIALADASICSILLVVMAVLGFNLFGIAGVVAWRRAKKRKELTAEERMKLEDL